MNTRRAVQVHLVLMVAVMAGALVVGPFLPDRVPIHWNWRGEADGWAPKFWGLLIPIVLTFLLGAFFVVLPFMASARHRLMSFLGIYWKISLLTQTMTALMSGLIIAAMALPKLDLTRWLVAALLIFCGLIGRYLHHVPPNPWIGVRTKWTFASRQIWNETHAIAGKLMAWSGLGGGVLVLLGLPWYIAFVAFMAASLWPIWYARDAARRHGLR